MVEVMRPVKHLAKINSGFAWQSAFKWCHAIQKRKRRAKRRAKHIVTRRSKDPMELPIPIRWTYVRVNKNSDRCGNRLHVPCVVNGRERSKRTRVSERTTKRIQTRRVATRKERKRHELPQRAKLKNDPGPGEAVRAPGLNGRTES